MNNDNYNYSQNNNGRAIKHHIYRTWSVAPDAADDAPFIQVVNTFGDTTYQVSTVLGTAGMIKVYVSPPLGNDPWTCAQHCGSNDITNIELREVDGGVWAYITFSNGDIVRSKIVPFMNICEDVYGDN